MRKVMLLAAMLAMVLAAAAPAFAQAIADDGAIADDSDETNTDVQYVDCSQVQAAAAAQGQYGDANAAADDESVATAEIAQDLGISQTQVNACLGEINVGTAAAGDDGDDAAAAAAAAGGGAAAAGGGSAAAGSASAAAGSASAAAAELPETGGASLLALGAGALLVAGGLLARRIVR